MDCSLCNIFFLCALLCWGNSFCGFFVVVLFVVCLSLDGNHDIWAIKLVKGTEICTQVIILSETGAAHVRFQNLPTEFEVKFELAHVTFDAVSIRIWWRIGFWFWLVMAVVSNSG
ncbi:hypothetical protein Dimus_028084 [Dionaea muscipula]